MLGGVLRSQESMTQEGSHSGSEGESPDTVILATAPLVRPLDSPWHWLKENLIQIQFLSPSEPSSATAQRSREDILVVLQKVNTQVGAPASICPLPTCPDHTLQESLPL